MAKAARKAAKKATEPRKRGGQPLYTPEMADEILRRLSNGETLRRICAEEGKPAASTVSMWAINDEPPGFAERYARARMLQADALAEEAAEISDHGSGDPVRDRLRVDTRKWLASKINPARFGDRQQLEHSGKVSTPVEFTFHLDRAGDSDGNG